MKERRERSHEEPLVLIVDQPSYPFDTKTDFNYHNLQMRLFEIFETSTPGTCIKWDT